MSVRIFKGTVIYTDTLDKLTVINNCHVVVQDGIIIDVIEGDLNGRYPEADITDYGNGIIIPAFTDLHMHAPQFVERGVGMDCLLFDWLNNYTFPQESMFKDTDYARIIYAQLLYEMIKHGTLHTALFTTIHYDSCDLLFRMLMESGMYAYASKINMDRNSPEFYVEDTQQSLADTERFIIEHKDLSDHVKPILIPRFAPTCSRELLCGLGKLAEKYDLGVHTHLVESLAEAAWSKELFPDCASDGEIYEKTGLLKGSGPKIFAHVIFPTETEDRILRQYDCVSVHCPDSTSNITAGIMPASVMLNRGLKIALGSDVGGGHFLGIYRQIARTVQISKMKEFYEPDYKRLVFANAFYMATVTGGEVFGKIGKIKPGYLFNALVLDNLQDEGYSLSPEECLERFCYGGDDRNIVHRFIDGKEIDPQAVLNKLKTLQ